ncbi:MAG: AAA family ATPase [Chloroflexi bacterium]|nr:AAA family ATPase [Chloroflexota bacterium]
MNHMMPFRKMHEAGRLLKSENVEIEDLVAVFTRLDSDQCLFIYNTDHPPKVRPPHLVQQLGKLKAQAYAGFDGPMFGLSAIDVMLEDVSTHGINFVSFKHIFQREGTPEQLAKLDRTCFHLATTLLDHLKRPGVLASDSSLDRGYAKIIQLALPTLLADQQIENLVAVVPKSDLRAFPSLDVRGFEFIYVESNGEFSPRMRQLLRSDPIPWVAAVAEAELFHESSKTYTKFVDLRAILRHMGKAQALAHTCRQLARFCRDKAGKATRDEDKQQLMETAYALVAESWLVVEAAEVQDLVALLPHCDFETFIRDGKAARVYRGLTAHTPASMSGPTYSLEDLARGQRVKPDYATAALTFGALEPAFRQSGFNVAADLGPVLCKVGQATALARVYWLLSRDLLQASGAEMAHLNVNLDAITDLALRAALIFSLSDPWSWREQRYDLFLRECYAHLDNCLLRQEQLAGNSPLAHYYRAVRKWYGCFSSDDHIRSLSNVFQACSTFLASSERRGDLRAQRNFAQRLTGIARSLMMIDQGASSLTHEVESPSIRAFEVANYLRNVTDSRLPIKLPSEPFEQCLRKYQALHAEWRQVHDDVHAAAPSREQLDRLVVDFSHLQRAVFAPAHELSLLRRVCEEDVVRINRLRDSSGSGPRINITLKTPWLTQDAREEILFEVTNLGGETAQQFKLDLKRTSEFDLLAPLTPASPELLLPGRGYWAACEIRTKAPTLTLDVNYSFRDHLGRLTTHQETFRLVVRTPQESGLKPRSNPYELSRPVSGGRFVGRSAELDRILRALAGETITPILLRGPRRIGKTSLMRQIDLVLSDRHELQRLGLEPELETQLRAIHPVFVSFQEISQEKQNYIEAFIQTIARDICRVLGLKWDEREVGTESPLDTPAKAFIRQMDWVFQQRPNAQVLVLIDEWDELYREEMSDLGRNVRYLLQHEQRIGWIFSSTWLLTEESGQFGSPFFAQLPPNEIKEMDWASAVRLVDAPSRSAGVEWRGPAVTRVLRLTACRPFLVQLMCYRVIEYLIETSSNQVDVGVVDVVADRVMKEAQTTAQYFGFLWSEEQIKSAGRKDNQVHWTGRLILWALDRSYPNPQTRLEIRHTIEIEFDHQGLALPDDDFLDREFNDQINKLHWVFDAIALDDDRYTLSIPLVQLWLRRMIAREDDLIQEAYAGLLREARA